MKQRFHQDLPIASRGYETGDAHFKSVLVSGAGLFGLMVFGLLISFVLYSFYETTTAQPGTHPDTFVQPNAGTLPPKPRLQSDPHAALIALRKTEDSVLTSYGWISEDSNIVRVPIDRAMELLVKKGLPVQSK